jgi:AraC family ethanolamine operon transcriptional activator
MNYSSLSTMSAAPKASTAVSVVEITDATAVGEGIEVIKQDAVLLDAGPLRSRRVVISLGKSVVVYQSTNQPIRVRTTLRSGLVAYVAFGPCAAGTMNGLPVGPDCILAGVSGVNVEFVVAAGYESVSILVPPNDLRLHLQLRQRADQSILPHGVELLRTNPGTGRGLFEWGRRVADAAASHPGVFDSPRTNAIAEHECFEMLLSGFDSAVEPKREPRDSTRRAYSRVVQIVEDYVLKHADEPLYVALLCKAASVSERTLQNAFKEIMGMTPVAFLTRMRLHQVRRALRAATPHSTTVTAEALKWGFWHLGEFSRAYKGCFDELPSDTLRRG